MARWIDAAGGVVWRDRRRRELAVIYRDLHEPDECCLPKGKLDDGEGWERAAEREVLEETGCRAAVERFAGLLHYHVGERPKVVVYFEMTLIEDCGFQPSAEVRKTEWLAPEAAVEALVHAGEREIVLQCLEAPDGSR